MNNYRVYDRTGSHVTQDITASSLEEAIQMGREWIEDGDWANHDDTDGVYRTITLECCVREITIVTPRPNLSGTELARVADLLALDRAPESIRGCDYSAMDRGQLSALANYLEAADPSVEDDDAEFDSSIAAQIREALEEEDEDVTDDQYPHDCSGQFSDTLPECENWEQGKKYPQDDEGHVWRAPHSIVKGCNTNPGVYSCGGTNMSTTTVCMLCGIVRTEVDSGSQRNPNEPLRTIKLEELSPATTKWLIETHAEDGWIPQWLAEYLDVLPTTRFTDETARKYVQDHDDADELDAEDLEHVFAALYGRRATNTESQEGLWSHCVAYVL